jgi:hypothetical protein
VHPKKRSVLITPALLLELASHAAMGIAVGLAFAFMVTHIPALGISNLMRYSASPTATLPVFVVTCAATFGIGATLTGLVITLFENHDADGAKK